MRLIDADKLKNAKFNDSSVPFKRGWNDAIDAIIECEPTIDAVEVVRCKDCKFGVYEKGRGIYHIRCEILEFLFQDDDYCSYGERREE